LNNGMTGRGYRPARPSETLRILTYTHSPLGTSQPDWNGAEREGRRAMLVAVLAFPWFVHAGVVGLSAVGAHPLAGRAVASVLMLAGVVFAGCVGRAAWQRSAGPEAAPGVSNPVVAITSAVLSWSGWVALVAGAAVAIALPISAYDALSYRLPTVAAWLDEGRVAWVTSDDPVRNGYPLGQEAVSAVVAAATGSLRFVAATSFLYVAAGALAIAFAAEACGVRRSVANAAGALFLLVPIVILNAPSGYVDAAFGGATVALVCLAAVLRRSTKRDVWLAAATGMAAAHVLALKGNGVVFVALTALLLFASSSARRSSNLAVALACALPGAFWALRNVMHTGNPLFPVSVQFAGHTLLHGVGSVSQILDEANNTPRAFRALGGIGRVLRTWFESNGPATDFDDRFAGLGLAWPALALPALLGFGWHAAHGERRREVGVVAFAAALTFVFLVLQPMKWWPRYTVWLWGAGALAIAVEAERLLALPRGRTFARLAPFAALLALVEGAHALAHANGALLAFERGGPLGDVRAAINAASWVDGSFWTLGLSDESAVCRGSWKPSTDNANLDGVFAQLTPRPHLHVLSDDDQSWPSLRREFPAAGCPSLLLFTGSPALADAERDPTVSVASAVAFDPLFVVRPRTPVALARIPEKLP